MAIKNKKIAVIGCGITGMGLANLLAEWGNRVSIYDENRRFPENIKDLNPAVEKFFGPMLDNDLTDTEIIVKSPGIPNNILPLKIAASKGTPVIGELEVVAEYLPKPTIAITGTNGKTTTTTITGKIAKNMGQRVFVGGNIGVSIARNFHNLANYDLSVLEVSSFQLENTESFNPHIAVLLNLTPDHLNRHGTMEDYVKNKLRIFQNQTKNDVAILNQSDPLSKKIANDMKGTVLFFDKKKPVTNGAYLRNGTLVIKNGTSEIPLVSLFELSSAGRMNIENLMAAALSAWCVGISMSVIKKTLIAFKGLPHRIESVAEIDEVYFINDSKGTNVGALEMALRQVSSPIILIAGGKDKGNDFTSVAGLVKKKAKAVFLIGESREKIKRQLRFGNTELCSSLCEAVLGAYALAQKKDRILFSPGCASFDMFRNYEDRGNQYKKIVFNLLESMRSE